MTFDFTTTSLWQRTLAEQSVEDTHAEARAALRSSYLAFRDAVKPLAGEISASMPAFTVHSIEHCDALWGVASALMPEEFELNPAESFVLGGAFLLHDLGMGLSAYERGEAELQEDPLYKDLLAQAVESYKLRAGSEPEAAELKEMEGNAVVAVLRRRHARQAERLVSRSFQTSYDDNLYLIEKTDLRHAWGALIGRIAHSHWFSVNDLADEFGQVKGSPSGYPAAWEVDPLKIACALRLADACHVDGDRAPTYLSAVRPVGGVSAQHWYFQERLNQPRIELDRIVYTSNVAFDSAHAQEWWLAYDTARLINEELRMVDALCQDLGRQRFSVRSVAGVESPERFSSYVEVQDWTPVDAKLKVTSVEDLAASLGGRNLYGNRPLVAVRELIANSADAVRARVTQYNITSDAAIYVSLEHHTDGRWWISVEDRGIGMSAERMLSALTDFGRSAWTSEEVLDDYPGLVSRGYTSIGRFGVGFYSVFMIADEVEVRSLKYREASRETSVLAFTRGLSGRPLLRRAYEREEIHTGGTIVRLRLKDPPLSKDGLLRAEEVDGSVGEMFQTTLRSMCALLEFDVRFKGPGDEDYETVVRGGEWKAASPLELFNVAYAEELRPTSDSSNGWMQLADLFAATAMDISDKSGDVIGRASLGLLDDNEHMPWWVMPRARVYIGGLEAGDIYGLLGVFVGEPLRADRLHGFPVASIEELQKWASSQASLYSADMPYGRRAREALNVARGFGVRLNDHPIVYSNAGFLKPSDVESWVKSHGCIYLIPTWELESYVAGSNLRLLHRDQGAVVELPSGVLYGDHRAQWIFPDEVREYPRDERFADYGELRAGDFNARYFWHLRGALGLPSVLLESIENAWNMTALEIADATSSHEIRHMRDDRLKIRTVDDGEVRVDAIRIDRRQRGDRRDSDTESGA